MGYAKNDLGVFFFFHKIEKNTSLMFIKDKNDNFILKTPRT